MLVHSSDPRNRFARKFFLECEIDRCDFCLFSFSRSAESSKRAKKEKDKREEKVKKEKEATEDITPKAETKDT